jgi:hypothetical protein
MYIWETGLKGTCISVDSSGYNCDDIKRKDQCENGGGMELLNGMCGLYGSVCKMKCEEINDEDICGNIRSEDCLWIWNDVENRITTQCKSKVLIICV